MQSPLTQGADCLFLSVMPKSDTHFGAMRGNSTEMKKYTSIFFFAGFRSEAEKPRFLIKQLQQV